LILGNKIDLPSAVSEDVIANGLGVAMQRTGKSSKVDRSTTRPLELFMCSVVKRAGYADGFKWLSQYL